MTTLHFVRHCDVHNPDGLIYGRLKGFGLSELGRAQAERLARFFSDRPVAAIYSSPQLRAMQTARVIRRHHPGVVVRTSRRLAEVFTSYQGLKLTDVPATINMFDNPKDSGDETMTDVYRRMRTFVDRVTCAHEGSEVVCISHAAPIAILRAGIEGRPLTVESIRGVNEPQKGSITALIFEPDAAPTFQYIGCP